MNTMKRIFSLLIITALIMALISCSSSDDSEPDLSKYSLDDWKQYDTTGKYYDKPEKLISVRDTIEYILNEAMARDRYKDNSAFYENEFQYLTDKEDFDTYIEHGEIKFERNDWVNKLDVISLDLFNHDSAYVGVHVHLEYINGDTISTTDTIVVYYHNNRWIKPTISVIKNQVEYEKLIKAAEEAASWEE